MAAIKWVDKLPSDIDHKMEKDLVAYEKSHGIDVNYKRFSLILSNDHNETVGVLTAYTAFAEIYIDDMWVARTHRRQGYGRKLIEELETISKARVSTILIL